MWRWVLLVLAACGTGDPRLSSVLTAGEWWVVCAVDGIDQVAFRVTVPRGEVDVAAFALGDSDVECRGEDW